MASQHGSHQLPTAPILRLASHLGCDYGHARMIATLNLYSSSLLYHHDDHFYHSCSFPFWYSSNGGLEQKPSDLAGRFQYHFDTEACLLQNVGKYLQVYLKLIVEEEREQDVAHSS
jgi:hypothetical protein